MTTFKVIRRDANGQRIAATGATKRPRPWAGEPPIWEGEAASESDALAKADRVSPTDQG